MVDFSTLDRLSFVGGVQFEEMLVLRLTAALRYLNLFIVDCC